MADSYFAYFANLSLNLLTHALFALMDQFGKQLVFYLNLSSQYRPAPVLLKLFPEAHHLIHDWLA